MCSCWCSDSQFYLGFHANKAEKNEKLNIYNCYCRVVVDVIQTLMRIVFRHSTRQNPWMLSIGNDDDEKSTLYMYELIRSQMRMICLKSLIALPLPLNEMTFSDSLSIYDLFGQTLIILRRSKWDPLTAIF